MKMMAIGLLALALVGVGAYAGYECVSVPKAAQTAQRKAGPEGSPWSGYLTRADGSVVSLKYVGGRFGSVDLQASETCRICIQGNSIRGGGVANIASTHGGNIRGQSRAEVSTTADGKICFDYTIGTLGEHPVQVMVGGQKVTLVLIARNAPAVKSRDELETQEARQ